MNFMVTRKQQNNSHDHKFMVKRMSLKTFSFLTTIGDENKEKILTTIKFMVMRILKILLTTIYYVYGDENQESTHVTLGR